jgi:EAL domain-containing protein (putative c-di-GMP-specific phosphodiesterase class I)
LLRWTHPSRGPISPTVFIPFAEQSGQIIGLGRWVLEQACADRHFWQRHSATNITMSVNISTHQFMSAGLARTVGKALIDTSTDPSLLTLEVTESVLVQDETRALMVFGELKQTGVKLALDDFGTGYSSLRYLDTMPIDIIKVDQSFVTKLPDQPRSREIVGAIVELAHGIGMTVVAEGVETAEQQHELAELGVDLCQGFYFALPMRREPVDSLIRADVGGTRLPTSQPG